MLEVEFSPVLGVCQYSQIARNVISFSGTPTPKHSRGSVVLDDRSDVISELIERGETRILRFKKCRGFRKKAPKEIEFQYDKLNALCITLRVKGVHAEHVKSRRLALGLTQEELGKLLGVSGRQIRYYEVGKYNIPEDKLNILNSLAKESASSNASPSVSPSVSTALQQPFSSISIESKSEHDLANNINELNNDSTAHVTRNAGTKNRNVTRRLSHKWSRILSLKLSHN